MLILQVVMLDHLVYRLPMAWFSRGIYCAVVGSNVCYMFGEVCLYVGYKVDSFSSIIVAFHSSKDWEPQSPVPNHMTSLF